MDEERKIEMRSIHVDSKQETNLQINLNDPKFNTSNYRQELDGLRAFAILFVIANHCSKTIIPSGYLGVDIFFVISGYVITSSLSRDKKESLILLLKSFLSRRIRRVLPALAAFVLITGVVMAVINPAPERILLSGFWGLTGVSNIYFFHRASDYFSQAIALNPYVQTWSLGVEEQFYVFFPFIIWFSGFGRQTKRSPINFLLIVGALAAISLVGFIYLYPRDQPAAYFLMPSRFWEIAAGCMIFIALQTETYIKRILSMMPPLVILGLMTIVMFLPTSLATASTLAIVILTSILIVCLKDCTAAFNILTTPLFLYIGSLSYSLYLWHWGILTIGHWTIGVSRTTLLPLLFLILITSHVSYYYLERPFKKSGYRTRTKSLAYPVITTCFSALTLLSLERLHHHLYAGSNLSYGSNPAPTNKSRRVLLGTRRIPADSDISVLTVGDSFIGHYYEAIDLALKELSVKGYMHIGYRFPITRREGLTTTKGRDFSYLGKTIEYYTSGKFKIKAIIISFKYMSQDFEALKQEMNNAINKASDNGINLIVIGPTPYFRNGTFALCQEEWYRPSISISSSCTLVKRSTLIKEFLTYNKYLTHLEKSYDKVHVIRPFAILCKKDSIYCDPVDKRGNYLYHDAIHLSSKGALKIKGLIKSTLQNLSQVY